MHHKLSQQGCERVMVSKACTATCTASATRCLQSARVHDTYPAVLVNLRNRKLQCQVTRCCFTARSASGDGAADFKQQAWALRLRRLGRPALREESRHERCSLLAMQAMWCQIQPARQQAPTTETEPKLPHQRQSRSVSRSSGRYS